MNFNPWQDYLNLRDVFFCKDWKRNNGRSFSEIEAYHFVQQRNESFPEDNIYFQNLKKELMKAVMTLARSTEQKMKTEKIKQMTDTKESTLKEDQTKNSKSYKEEKNQNVTSSPKMESDNLVKERNAAGTESFIENNISSLNSKKELLKVAVNTRSAEQKKIEDNISSLNSKKELLKVAVNTKSAEQKMAEKNQQILKTRASILKMLNTPKQKQVTKNMETNKEEGKNQNAIVPCSFCRRNGERKMFYMTHSLKNSKGDVTCPILQKYVCPKCQATGLNAHTLLYCPQNNEYHSASLTHLTPRMSSGKKRQFQMSLIQNQTL